MVEGGDASLPWARMRKSSTRPGVRLLRTCPACEVPQTAVSVQFWI